MSATQVAVANMPYWKINEHQRYDKQTALVPWDSDLQVPDFILKACSTGLLPTSLPQLVGAKPIAFPDSLRFERQFVLSGPTEIAIRALFTKSVRDIFECEPHLQSRGQTLKPTFSQHLPDNHHMR